MVQLTELPDDILNAILLNFKLSPQRSRYLRRADEAYFDTREQDVVKRADLIAIALVSKALYALASPLLYESRYLHVDMLRSSAMTIEGNLARLSSYKRLDHLLCALWSNRIIPFFTCLENAASSESLQGLSVSLYGVSDTGTIDLRRLSRFPNLLGLELRSDANIGSFGLLVPPPASLPSLRELHIDQVGTFAQTVEVLSLASPSALEVLGLYASPLLGPDKRTTVWAGALEGSCFPHVHTLCIGRQYYGSLNAEMLAEIPTYFPSLSSFDVGCTASETDFHGLLSGDIITSLSFEARNVAELTALLLCITTDGRPNSRLQSIHIDVESLYDGWDASSDSDLIALAQQACGVARARGIILRPTDLPDALAKRAVIEQERKSRGDGW